MLCACGWITLNSVAAASAASAPLEGVFDDCPLQSEMSVCAQRLQVMQRGGMQVVVIPIFGVSPSAVYTYAAAAHSLGMSVMWDIGSPSWWESSITSFAAESAFAPYASLCDCSDDVRLLAYLIGQLAQLQATYGYYAADDSVLAAGDQSAVGAYITAIKRSDPNHPVVVSGYSASQATEYVGVTDMAADEDYPVTTQSTLSSAQLQNVADDAATMQRAADQAGKATAFILQAFTWGDNLSDGEAVGVCSPSDTTASCYAKLTYPSSAAQLQLRNTVLENAQPKLILWWSFDGTYGATMPDSATIYPTGAVAAERWSGLCATITAPVPGSAASSGQPSRVTAAARDATTTRIGGAQRTWRRHRRHAFHHRGWAHPAGTRPGARSTRIAM